jgi:hypothetical protein
VPALNLRAFLTGVFDLARDLCGGVARHRAQNRPCRRDGAQIARPIDHGQADRGPPSPGVLSLTGNPGPSANLAIERHHRDALCCRVHTPQSDLILAGLGKAALGLVQRRVVEPAGLGGALRLDNGNCLYN